MNKLKLPDYQCFFSIFITMLSLMWSGWALKMDQKTDQDKDLFTDPPLSPGHPFLFIWNAPTEFCAIRYRVPLDLSHFHLIGTPVFWSGQPDQSITLFYIDSFGRFPYYDHNTHKEHHGGLPQLTTREQHHEDANKAIKRYIPSNQQGLAVLDFEEWRPLWKRNWGKKSIYRLKSMELVRNHTSWTDEDKVLAKAKEDYEAACKRYFIDSLRIGKQLRPNRLWGYYLFPDCYNYEYNRITAFKGYTGECPKAEQNRNDELIWLWKECTALYPSIYLEIVHRNRPEARSYIRYRMQETIRVSQLPLKGYSIPIHPYIRPVYKDSVDNYMNEADLVKTIGEAAALGAASVVSWGDMALVKSMNSCLAARNHLRDIMNPYILNVTTATQLCSRVLCRGQGRCMRKDFNTSVYLHLNPKKFQIKRQYKGGPLTVSGSLTQDTVNEFDRHFKCMCYSRKPCRSVMRLTNIASSKSGGAPHALLLVMRLICLMYVVMWK